MTQALYSATFSFAMLSTYVAIVRGFKLDDVIFCFANCSFAVSACYSHFLLFKFSSDLRKNGNLIWNHLSMTGNCKVLKILRIAIYQMNHSELIASCGLYEFNWKILLAIMANAFSYMITGIQFDMNSD